MTQLVCDYIFITLTLVKGQHIWIDLGTESPVGEITTVVVALTGAVISLIANNNSNTNNMMKWYELLWD